MSHRLFVGMAIEMIIQEPRRQARRGIEELRQTSGARFDLLGSSRAQNLYPVARRNDQSLAHNFTIHKVTQSISARFVIERESLANFDRSGLVINSDEDDRHTDSESEQQPERVIAAQQASAEQRAEHERKSQYTEPRRSSPAPIRR